MDANKFFKKHGLAEVKILLTSPSHGFFFKEDFYKHYGFDIYDDLKRLVESHELVEIYTRRFNGDAEWFFVSEYCKKNRISPFFSENYNKASGIYKQAIADVEGCL